MIREKSCGAVVYTITHGELKYLIVQMLHGHFGFPKGHVEKDETEAQTAAREIREETGLTVSIHTEFRRSIEYSPYAGCTKEVVYFIASADHTRMVRQPEEIREIQWLSFEQALAVLSYKNDKDVLIVAHEYLNP